MIDLAKRNTLKALAVTTAAAGSAAFASGLLGQPENTHTNTDPELAEIEVTSRVSVQHNDLEIVFTNTGKTATTITQMTPHQIHVARGDFELATLLKDGPLTLEAGESVTVPLAHKPAAASTGMNHSATSLKYVIKNNVSIMTDHDAYAKVSVLV